MRRRRKKRKIIQKFSKKMQKKLIVMFLVVTVLLVGLIGRLMYIEYTSGDKYEKIVLSQQEYDSRIIPYQRGDIVDTKGTILATSVDVYNVILDCKVLNQNKDDIEPTILALTTCFPDLKAEDIRQKLTENAASQYVVLLKKLPYDTIQPFVEMQGDDKNYPNVNSDAVWFEKEYIRSYPYGSLAASLVGFVSGGNVGTVGMENYYNSTLNGINGRQYGYLNSDNNFEKTIKEAKDGDTIVSTVDVNIQSVVEEKLAKFNEEYTNGYIEGSGSKHTAALVMNPQNGEIYAMANFPTFDLNDPRNLTGYVTPEEEAGMTEEEKMDFLNEIWENFCVTYTYEPGSTIKPFTIATGLETGTLRGDETYYCDGLEVISGSEVHCVSRVGHGMETIQKALMDSCNDALMQMSYSIGVDNFTTYQKIFGFGQKTGIDLPGEERGLLFEKDQMRALDLATNSFGQNFNCTMIQVASAFSSLVNGGKYYQPHIVKKIEDSNGNVIENIKPVLLKETISEETSDMLKTYLYATVSEGTAKTAKVNGYSMGGKTGTAQKLPRANKTYLVSFIGYVPQENPQLVVYVIVDEPNVEEQAHSTYAQNIAREILEEILPYMNLYPDEELVQTEDDQSGQGASAGSADGTTGEASTGTGEGTAAGTGDGTAGEATANGAGDGTTGEATANGTDAGTTGEASTNGTREETAGDNTATGAGAGTTGDNTAAGTGEETAEEPPADIFPE